MKGYSFRSLTDLVLKIFKTEVNAGIGLSGGGSLEADRTLTVKYGTAAGTAAQGNDSRLSNSREWTAATISQAEAEEGVAKTRRAFTSERVRQSIVKWWSIVSSPFGQDFITSTDALAARIKLGLGEHALRWPTWGEVTGKPSTFTPTTHTHPWSQVTGQPVTATRWPSLAEITGKPTHYPTTWNSVASKPAQATRWPSWEEVTGKPIQQGLGNSSTDIMSQKAISDAIREVWPVGVCYTQYPHTPTPAMLFGGTWKLLFANEGTFFRTEGVGASAFESGLQQDSLKSHRHDASSSGAGGHAHSGTTSTTGNHAHSGTTSTTGNHTHSGSLGVDYGRGGWQGSKGFEEGLGGVDWKAGPMGASGSHNHSLSINAAGNHNHTLSTDTIENHTHAITVSNTGDTETRPRNRTIRVWQRIA